MLAVATLVFYGPGLGGPVSPSADGSVLDLPLLSGWHNAWTILSPEFSMFTDGQYRPGGHLLLAALGSMAAEAPWLWHLWQLLFHWGNALLVAALAFSFTGSRASAALGGLLFLLHPIGSTVVLDVDQFHHVAGLSCFLGALYLHVRNSEGQRVGIRIGALAVCAAGLTVSKVLFGLPALLVAWEAVRLRAGWRDTLKRVGPYLAIGAVAGAVRWGYGPHPLHFAYPKFPDGTGWWSLYSAVGATGEYLGGLLLGQGIPTILREVVSKVHSPLDPSLWGWAVLHICAVGAGGIVLRREPWGIGLLLPCAAMLPFTSTAWNPVVDYVAWEYAHAPVAGLALVVAGCAGALSGSSPARRAATAVLWLSLAALTVRLVDVSLAYRSPLTYWMRVVKEHPQSEEARLQLGTLHLEQDDLTAARGHLFAPNLRQADRSSMALCRYFTAKGDLWPAAIHLRMTVVRGGGLQYGITEPLKAELMLAAHAYDHAEEALGAVLTSNPYATGAMAQLASVWARKGYVKAAGKLARRLEELAPASAEAAAAHQSIATAGSLPGSVVAPSQAWLGYATRGDLSFEAVGEILASAVRHPEDPVIAMEAASCHLRRGEIRDALVLSRKVTQALPNSALAWSTRSWAATRLQEYEEAMEATRRALMLEPGSAPVNNVAGILYGHLAHRAGDDEAMSQRAVAHFERALRADPLYASARTNLASELGRLNRTEEAAGQFQRVLRYHPDMAEAHLKRGNLWADQGDPEKASVAYRRALVARPLYAEAHHNLGIMALQAGDVATAVRELQAAMRARPDYGPARDDLARLFAEGGQWRRAVAILKEGLLVTPGHTRGALLLASMLTHATDPEVRDPLRAVLIAERVSRALGGQSVNALLILAAAQKEAGETAQAVASARRAVGVAEARGDSTQRASARSRVAEYSSKESRR